MQQRVGTKDEGFERSLMSKTRSLINIIAWSLFNLACTIYSINIVSLHFALWVTVDQHGADILYSLAFSISVFLAALGAPIVGYCADRINRRMPFLLIFATGCFLGTILLSITHNLYLGLLLFILTNFCYQSTDIVQNMLLPHISGKNDVGRVAGFGTGLGYFGTIIGVIIVGPIAAKYGHQSAFIPTALLFMVFALPCFFLIQDRVAPNNQVVSLPKLLDIFRKPIITLLNIKAYPDFAISLLAIFLAFNTIDTIFVFMSVYLQKIAGFQAQEFTLFYVACAAFAIMGGVGFGFVVDRIGPKRVLFGSMLLWSVALFLAMLASGKTLFWIIGPMLGVSLGATWTSSRTLIVALAPKAQTGEFFGCYGFVIKVAAILGPMVWGTSVWLFSFLGMLKYRVALAELVLFMLIGLIILTIHPLDTNASNGQS